MSHSEKIRVFLAFSLFRFALLVMPADVRTRYRDAVENLIANKVWRVCERLPSL